MKVINTTGNRITLVMQSGDGEQEIVLEYGEAKEIQLQTITSTETLWIRD